MKTEAVIAYYGTQMATAAACKCDQSTVSDWLKAVYPPDARQLQIETLTDRKLLAEPGCLERVLRLPNAEKQGA